MSQQLRNDENLHLLAGLLSRLVDGMVKRFMEALSVVRSEGLLRHIRSDAALRVRFEIHAFAVLYTDVTAMAGQTPEVRKRLFEATSLEMLKSLKNMVPDYDEAVFNRELHQRMVQYATVMNEPTMPIQVPREIRIWGAQQANLTEAVCKKGLFSNRKLEQDVVSVVYRESCMRRERGMRRLVTNLLTASNDFSTMSEEDLDRAWNETAEAIIEHEMNRLRADSES